MIDQIKLPKEITQLCGEILPLRDISEKNILKSIKSVYCFWWLADKKILFNSDRKIQLKGPGNKFVELKYEIWFPAELTYIPLYVGKTTKLKSRISKHLLLKSSGRVHGKPVDYKKTKPKNSSCQLRFGIEHIFPNIEKPKDFILKNIGLSFIEVDGENAVSRRFYLEDFAIGYFKPWFNLDSER